MTSAACKAPYAPQDVQEVQTLIQNLTDAQIQCKNTKKKFSCKKNDFIVTGSSGNHIVSSWRFHDWDYKCPDLPVYARGLFTRKDENGQNEIVIRGYDKFFNTGEVSATKWKNIEANTKGPYELSTKENGCIIFISGLQDGSLLVCSKHSTGPRSDGFSHAVAGEKWVAKQLSAIGKTREQLAKELHSRNATAVAELCDDSFEEHILAYNEEDAGLYLHGININIPKFKTYPGEQVQEFAAQWGFRKTDFLVHHNIQAAKKFLDDVAETGSYNGRDIEGFVVRCKARKDSSAPYEDWFFKYKFEEPYLMYRQWRECTKALISGKKPLFKKNVEITNEYLLFAKKKLSENPSLRKAYGENHGIIKLRNDFLKERNIKGSDVIRQEYAANGGASQDVAKDIILVPVATIGCGKTTIGVALQNLFGWGHVQNDNIFGKNRQPQFTKKVLVELSNKPLVFADRNNTKRHERLQLINDVHSTHPDVRLVALNFIHARDSLDKIRQVTKCRILSRGDNHQTIQAATAKDKAMSIMESFMQGFQPFNSNTKPDDRFDAVIDLDPTVETRKNLETVVCQLHNMFPKLLPKIPSSKDLDNAIGFALNEYKPEPRQGIPDRGRISRSQNQSVSQPEATIKTKPVEYFSVTLERSQILDIVENIFSELSPDNDCFWKQLKNSNRIQSELHVTLIHRASAKAHPQLWQRYSVMFLEACGDSYQSGKKIGSCKILLERIVWDRRLMAVVVRLFDQGWECVNQIAHITLGTRGEDVKPKESNDLLKKWIEVGSGHDSGIWEVAIQSRQVIDGSVIGVLSR